MGAGTFVMVLIGCAQGQTCAPVMTLPVAYRSKASCLADRTDMVAASDGLGYERLFAECREQSRVNKLQTSARRKANGLI